jgi:MFS family permease
VSAPPHGAAPWPHAAPSHPDTIGADAWRALAAAFLGWMLDGMDIMLYAFALTAIRVEFGLSAGAVGALASVTLVTSAIGGVAAGYLADRFGRARVLVFSILVYSVFTAATATAGSVAGLLFWRALVGFGLGAEWSAGSVLVAETWPSRHRGKAIGFVQSGWAVGYLLAAALAALVLPRWGWRTLFVLGILPAILTLWIRRRVAEPAVWRAASAEAAVAGAAAGAGAPGFAATAALLLRPPLRRLALVATTLATVLLFAYWGLFTWMPTFLASPVTEGGAGLGIVRSSMWIVVMQVGAFLGYNLFGVLADRFGRRPAFALFVGGAALIVPAYGLLARQPVALLALSPVVGFLGHGYFSLFGALLAELFPSAIRATAQGACYNIGRAVSALAPFAIGAAADRMGYGAALALTSGFYVAGLGLVFLLPETRGRDLA